MSSNRETNKTVIVTTSWDDGDQLDLKLAELLRANQVSATFYIPVEDYRPRTLSRAQMRSLADEGFEIGAHSVSHKLLRGLTEEELASEIAPCKPILEDITGHDVRMFCYPEGKYDSRTVRTVKKAGYSGARTVRMLSTGADFDPFQIPTTVQSFPHPPATYFKNAAKARKFESLRACFSHRAGWRSWVELGKSLFDSVEERGGIWHMYGHSWEIEEFGLWNDLGKLLEYVSRRPGVRYVPNRELVGCPSNQA